MMKFEFKNHSVLALMLVISALLAGCSSTKTLYGWNDYQPEVYDYFQGSSPDAQIITLEKNLEEFKAHGQLTPPGFHAHLGMLYAQVGDMGRAAQEFNTEKRLFPESAPYMDFLLNKKDLHNTVATKSKNASNKNSALKNQEAIATPVSSYKNQTKEQ